MGHPEEAYEEKEVIYSEPPSYKAAVHESTEYFRPSYTPSSSSSGVNSAQTGRFPPSFNLYNNSVTSNSSSLGEHKDQPLYLVSWHTSLSSSPPVVLYSGPDKSSPQLASIHYRVFHSSFHVDLPPIAGSPDKSAREIVESIGSKIGAGEYRFSIETGPNNVRETFEWRHASGGSKKTFGWNLLRLAQGSPGSLNDEKVAVREGEEVVASWFLVGGSLSTAAAFNFSGTALSGNLGERWAIMAVITACGMFGSLAAAL